MNSVRHAEDQIVQWSSVYSNTDISSLSWEAHSVTEYSQLSCRVVFRGSSLPSTDVMLCFCFLQTAKTTDCWPSTFAPVHHGPVLIEGLPQWYCCHRGVCSVTGEQRPGREPRLLACVSPALLFLVWLTETSSWSWRCRLSQIMSDCVLH